MHCWDLPPPARLAGLAALGLARESGCDRLLLRVLVSSVPARSDVCFSAAPACWDQRANDALVSVACVSSPTQSQSSSSSLPSPIFCDLR